MTATNIRARRIIAAGTFAVAAVAAPVLGTLASSDSPDTTKTVAQCLAWFGNKEDGKCLSYSNGNGINVATPDIGIYGPDAGSMPGGGIGIGTAPLLPGHTYGNTVGN